jgi:protocatechuate 3,4-dioxygenase beta subunit
MEYHDDDKPIGRVLTRREMLALLGGMGGALIAGAGIPRLVSAQGGTTPTPSANPSGTPMPSCVVRPELAEGPFFVDTELNRVDIRIDPVDETMKEGLPLLLTYRVMDVSNGMCAPLANAQVDVWHCDADGIYSGVGDRRSTDTREQLWLRGYQVTDEDGIASFVTVIPGWYPGRAVHIHFKIRTENGYDFASQLFFEPEIVEEIYQEEPYAARGLPNVPNSRDGIFLGSDGLLTLQLEPLTEKQLEELEEYALESGYSATFDIGLDMS